MMTLKEQIDEFLKVHVRYYSTDGAMIDVATLRAVVAKALRPEEARASDLWTLWWKMYRQSESGNRMVCSMAAALDKTPQELSPIPQQHEAPKG